jgi:hypothetical protein
MSTSNIFLFNNEVLEKSVIKGIEYFISIDTFFKENLTYCFGRVVDGRCEIMLSKIMRDENEFNQEVENLAKYFNAKAIK